MKKKEIRLKITAEDYGQKVSINLKICDGEDYEVTMYEFYSACEQLAYAMGYSKEVIKKYFTTE